MTHHKAPNSKKWVEFSRSREQRRRSWRKEVLYMSPLMIALLVMVFLPSITGLVIAGIISGLPGIIIIWKKEMPTTMVTVRGKPAVAGGVFYLLLMWGLTMLIIMGKIFKWQ